MSEHKPDNSDAENPFQAPVAPGVDIRRRKRRRVGASDFNQLAYYLFMVLFSRNGRERYAELAQTYSDLKRVRGEKLSQAEMPVDIGLDEVIEPAVDRDANE